MADLQGGFSGNMLAKTKHTGKACGGLWGQWTIFEAFLVTVHDPGVAGAL